MIISHRHRFIFMHSRKTAGSSMSVLLNRHLGPRDIQIGTWPDCIANGGRYNRATLLTALSQPRRLLGVSLRHSRKTGQPGFAPFIVNRIVRETYEARGITATGAHAHASEIRAFAPEAWDSYFKFSFVRNPWTHAVSDYYWRLETAGKPDVDFREFIRRLEDPERPDPEELRPPVVTNWPIYTIDDEIALDHVARYEALTEETDYIGRQIGLPLDLSSVHAKGRVRNHKKDIAGHYDTELVEAVGRIYAKEVRAFGYEPPF